MAAECILIVEKTCSEGKDLIGTVGKINAEPGAVNVIPGDVQFTIDLRAAQDENRLKALDTVIELMTQAAKRRDVDLLIEKVHEAESVPCNDQIMDNIERAISDCGIPPLRLPSGAGHDAAAMAELVPVGMIFIRCEGGISHNPDESITTEDAMTGTEVLFRTLCNLVIA